MKRIAKNILLFVSVLFLSASFSGINVRAADSSLSKGMLFKGNEFNKAIKQLVTPGADHNYEDDTIKKIVFDGKNVVVQASLPKKEVGNNVYAYYDAKNREVHINSTSVKIYFNPDSSGMFARIQKVERIEFGDKVDTSKCTNMSRMFLDCFWLDYLDISCFSTGNVTNMSEMFYRAYIRHFYHKLDTHSVINMRYMFFGCDLTWLDLSNFNTSKVRDMSYMFAYCCDIPYLNLETFDTSNVTNMRGMFQICNALENMDFTKFKKFNTSKVTDMSEMFMQCVELEMLNLSSFDTSNVTNMSKMFYRCESICSFNIKGFNTAKVTNMDYMFYEFHDTIYTSSNDPDLYDFSSLDLSANPSTEHMLDELSTSNGAFKSPKNVRVEVKLPGRWIIDDNGDGRSDDGVYYTSLRIDGNSHIYRHRYANYPFYDDDMTSSVVEPAAVSVNSVLPDSVTMDNITYRIDENGSATVTKITSSGKVKIDNAMVNGVAYPVTAISDGACQGNKKIKSVVIGSSVKKIGKNAFKGCKSLENVTIKANKSLTIGKGAFKKINKKSSIKVKGVKGSTKKKLIKAIGD